MYTNNIHMYATILAKYSNYQMVTQYVVRESVNVGYRVMYNPSFADQHRVKIE